ncbi:hypothetical protein GCM10011452_26690 [Gemmobacter lanyuensis]|uniref:Alpha/beta hydrolase n=1 Tax=Gemmobacter lanyuensis TaxID=1054497 RepID=A0A918J084_9RHOB|nr:alpha/beta hydrolase [Gemmobacter lanyuensis]GGW36820.1 hypothetical protein GCM10011452_26690 [Gemmobacter lanyuensis]
MIEPVILIPGLCCDARVFEHQVLHLSQHRPVMLAQPKGVTVEEMSANLLAMAPPKFAVVGQGLGGDVALDLVRRALDRVTRVALLSTDPMAEAPALAAAREARMVAARAGRLFQAVAEEYPAADMGPAGPMIQPLLRAMAEHLGEGVFLAQSKAMQRRPDQQKTMRRAMLPALIMGGGRDSLVPQRRHDFVAQLMPFATLQMFEGVGHLLSLEAPEAVTAALETFLRGPMLLR